MTDILIYLWLLVVALIGAVTGSYTKVGEQLHNKCFKDKVNMLLIGVSTSMFIAYITFEFAFFLLNKNGVSVAIAGLASFVGTDFAIVLERKFIELIEKRLK